MENIRYNISPCAEREVSDFIDRIDKTEYIPNGEVRATERSHYDRYSFLREECRVAVVFDTNANILSITGRRDHSKFLLELFDLTGKTVKMSTVPAQGTQPVRAHEAVTTIQSQTGMRAKLFVSPERIRRQADVVPTGMVFASSRGVLLATDEIYPPQTVKRRPAVNTEAVQSFRTGVGDESIITRQTAAESIEQSQRREQAADLVSTETAPKAGISISLGRKNLSMPRRATISFGSEDDEAVPEAEAHTQKRKRGRPPKIESQIPDIRAAEITHIGKRRGRPPKSGNDSAVELLKKRLPTACLYLSEQARKDFSYCLRDFEQKELKLSDYSVLLVPAFRGLERFVFDLQEAENIKVKMIGQAFDKDESGNYVLKSGYRQRINSVIYAEVMVSLYTEYFSQRNYFAHSDNSSSTNTRSLSDMSSAKKIFDRLLDAVEYNSKKLREIGFNINTVTV